MSVFQLFRGKEKATSGTDQRKGGKRLRRVAALAAAASIVTAAAATPAYAVNPPDPFSCAWNTTFGGGDYFWLKVGPYDTTPEANLCYVNSGVIALRIDHVQGFHSGNNAGVLTYTCCNTYNRIRAFNKWEDNWDYLGTVNSLGIF
jgi:hypothetical protein